MDGREMRGMEIAATVPLRRTKTGWVVPSQSQPGAYEVTSDHPHIATMDIIGGLVVLVEVLVLHCDFRHFAHLPTYRTPLCRFARYVAQCSTKRFDASQHDAP